MKSSANKQENNGTKENGKSKKLNYFLIFLVCWLVLVTGFIAWFTAHFNAHDVEYIWENMAQKPEVTVFENEETVKAYVTSLISDKSFVCAEADTSTDSDPEFYVKTSDGLVVAKIILAEDKSKELPYGFKAWKEGKHDECRKLQKKANEVISIIKAGADMGIFKDVLKRRGVVANGLMRRPLVEIEKSEGDEIWKALQPYLEK